jgi:hypothetical protein
MASFGRTAFAGTVLLAVSSFAAGSQAQAAETIAYYRFETGPAGAQATSIVDSSGNLLNGSILGAAPVYVTGVDITEVPQTRQANNFSMSFGVGQAASFAYAFPFNTLKDATLELWINPGTNGMWDFIWTTTASGDQNRFNIYLAPLSTPVIPSACLDYREPSGMRHYLGCSSPGTVPVNEWSYVAYVKHGNDYSIYVNSSATGHITTLTSQVTDVSPNLPTVNAWTINGRYVINGCGCLPGSGLLDEVRLSNEALSPSEFLIAPPLYPVPIAINPPAQAPVSISLTSNYIPVAFLSSQVFDARVINPSTVQLSGAQAQSCRMQDVNGDGLPDLLCYVNTNQLQLTAAASVAVLTGRTHFGVLVGGGEAISVVP